MKKLTANDLRGKIIDVHTHSAGIVMSNLAGAHYPTTQNLADLSDIIRAHGIDYAVTFPMPSPVYFGDRACWLDDAYRPSGLSDFPYQYENRYLLEMVDHFHLSNVLPFLSFSTRDRVDEQLQTLRDLCAAHPVYGLKYHTTTDNGSVETPAFGRFAAFAEENDLPIMVHTALKEPAGPEHVLSLALQRPRLRVCAAHCARLYAPFFRRLDGEGGRFPNVFLDLAPLHRLCLASQGGQELLKLDYADPLAVMRAMCERYGERVMWGTDLPWHRYALPSGQVIAYRDEVRTLRESGAAERLSANAARFLFGA